MKNSSLRIQLIVCTVDKNSIMFKRFYDSLLETTKNIKYDLIIVENNGVNFHHPSEINNVLLRDNDLVVTCDDDIFFHDNWLEESIEFLNNDNKKEVGIVGFVNKVREDEEKNNIVINKPTECFLLYSSCMIIRNLGITMPEKYKKYYFEIEFCVNMWNKGIKAMCLPNIVSHEKESTMKNLFSPKDIRAIRNKDYKLFSEYCRSIGGKDLLYKNIKEKYPNLIKKQPLI